MATKGVNPFARFQKPGKDKDKGMKEGSKKDAAMDKMKMSKMKHGGVTKMAMGGAVHKMPDGSMMAGRMKEGGMTKMAMGGGIESKGKTKGTMVRMKNGGKAC